MALYSVPVTIFVESESEQLAIDDVEDVLGDLIPDQIDNYSLPTSQDIRRVMR